MAEKSKFPDMDQKIISSLHRHPEMSHEVVKETFLILQENQS